MHQGLLSNASGSKTDSKFEALMLGVPTDTTCLIWQCTGKGNRSQTMAANRRWLASFDPGTDMVDLLGYPSVSKIRQAFGRSRAKLRTKQEGREKG